MPIANASLADELVARGVARHEARWLVEEFTTGSVVDEAAVCAAAQRRMAGEPLQYVLGHWTFRSVDLVIDRRVLIPRPETELIVDLVKAELLRMPAPAPWIVDMGCGSGAIGLSLLTELAELGVAAHLVAVDASAPALEVARENARRLGVAHVSFVQSDWYHSLDAVLRGRVDVLVANPPYVADAELESADPVLSFEPRIALVASDAVAVPGFAGVAALVAEAPTWLAERGSLVIEHGAAQGPPARRAAVAAGFARAETKKDLTGRDRFLVASQLSWRDS